MCVIVRLNCLYSDNAVFCSDSLEVVGQIDVIYTDLEKAFDKVPHQKLVEKLDIQSKP